MQTTYKFLRSLQRVFHVMHWLHILSLDEFPSFYSKQYKKEWPLSTSKIWEPTPVGLTKVLVTEDKLNLEVMPVCSGLN
jgi:hypothetical protein